MLPLLAVAAYVMSHQRADLAKLVMSTPGARLERRALLDVVVLDAHPGDARVEASAWRDHGWVVEIAGVSAPTFKIAKRDGARTAAAQGMTGSALDAVAALFALSGVVDVKLTDAGVLRVRVDGIDSTTLAATADLARDLAREVARHAGDARGALPGVTASGAPFAVVSARH